MIELLIYSIITTTLVVYLLFKIRKLKKSILELTNILATRNITRKQFENKEDWYEVKG